MRPDVRKPIAAICAVALATVSAVTLTPQPANGAQVFTDFRATLLQLNEVSGVPFTGAYGSADLRFRPDTRQLSYEVRVAGIPSATLAHIHQGLVGVNGPVIFDLLGSKTLNPATPVSGTVTLSMAQVDDLFAGEYYVNIHTVAHPGGEMRGQVFPREAIRTFGTQLTGEAETPPIISGGAGSALVMLNDKLDQFAFQLQVSGIPSATMSHIHQAPPGAPGPVVFDLLALGGGTLDPATPISGTSPISPTQVATLLDGDYYVNVHTVANPPGELRGQLGPNALFLQAPLSGANEVPPVVTNASGLASFDFTQSSGSLQFDVSVTGIPSATMAHIHRGPAGVNGPVVFDLLATGGGKLDPLNALRGAVSLTATQAISLLNSGYYVNVHTVANPSGEVRGQIETPQQFLTYQSSLNGANELPTPVTTTATAEASLVLDTATNELTFKILTQNITPTAMHIHTGTVTQTGNVAFDLGLTGSGVVTLTNEQAHLMAAGGYYINVHTAANPAGEIRGQVYPAVVPSLYFAALGGVSSSSAAAVEPEAVTLISGLSFFRLDPNQTRLEYSFTTSKPVSVTLATINRGAPGEIGPPVTTIFSGTAAVGPGQALSGTTPLTPAVLNDILLNTAYIEIQSSPPLLFAIRGDITSERRAVLPFIAR
jgi:hypothetical protein